MDLGSSKRRGSKYCASSGASSKESSNDTPRVATITSASGAKNWPVIPDKNVSGRNATMVVTLEPTIAGVIAASPV